VTAIRVALVDVVVFRRVGTLEILLLRRSSQGRNPGSWESVHGSIDAGETPIEAARRELREECGAVEGTLYNLSRVESFYRHDRDEVALIPVFAFEVPRGFEVHLSDEHDRFTWSAPSTAQQQASWPRLRESIAAIEDLIIDRRSATLMDVLRVQD
jgi:8-oxo-dGTP pyrophosphatase MutT (NUDIX family)